MVLTRHKTQAFILRQENKREADKVFTLFSKEFGKISVLGKSIRTAKSKLRGNMSIFSFLDIEFIQGKTQKTLVDANLIENHENMKQSLERLSAMDKIVDVFDKLVRGTEKELKLWSVFEQVFNVLNDPNIDFNSFSVCHWFYWRLFAILGYCPELYNCLMCGKKLKINESYFTGREGIICSHCLDNKEDAVEMNIETIKILREIFQRTLKGFLEIKIEKKFEKNLEQVFNFHFSHIY